MQGLCVSFARGVVLSLCPEKSGNTREGGGVGTHMLSAVGRRVVGDPVSEGVRNTSRKAEQQQSKLPVASSKHAQGLVGRGAGAPARGNQYTCRPPPLLCCSPPSRVATSGHTKRGDSRSWFCSCAHLCPLCDPSGYGKHVPKHAKGWE